MTSDEQRSRIRYDVGIASEKLIEAKWGKHAHLTEYELELFQRTLNMIEELKVELNKPRLSNENRGG